METGNTEEYSSIILKKTSPILNLISFVLGSQDLNVTNKKKSKNKSKTEKDDRVLVMLKAGLNMMAVKISNLNKSFGFIKTLSDLFVKSEDLIFPETQGNTSLAIEQLKSTGSPSDVFGPNLSFGNSNIFDKFVDNFASQDAGLFETGVIGSGIGKLKISSTYEFGQSVSFLTESKDISIKQNLNQIIQTKPTIQFNGETNIIGNSKAIKTISIQRQELLLKVLESNQILDDILYQQESIIADSFYDTESSIKFEQIERFPGNPPSDNQSSDENEENVSINKNPIILKRRIKTKRRTLVEPVIPEEPIISNENHVGGSAFVPENTGCIIQNNPEIQTEKSNISGESTPNKDSKDVNSKMSYPVFLIEDFTTEPQNSIIQYEVVDHPIIKIEDLSTQSNDLNTEQDAIVEDSYTKIEDIYHKIQDLDTEIVDLYTEIGRPVTLIEELDIQIQDQNNPSLSDSQNTSIQGEKAQQEDVDSHLEDRKTSTLDPNTSILDPNTSILDPKTSIFDPNASSSILDPNTSLHNNSDQQEDNNTPKQPTTQKMLPNIKDLFIPKQHPNAPNLGSDTEKENENGQNSKREAPNPNIRMQKFASQIKDLYNRNKGTSTTVQDKTKPMQNKNPKIDASKDRAECKQKEILQSNLKSKNDLKPLSQHEDDFENVDFKESKKDRKATSTGAKILEVVLEKDRGHQQNIVGTFIISQNLKMGDKIREAKIVRMLKEQFNYTTILRLDEELKIQVDKNKLITLYKIQLNTH